MPNTIWIQLEQASDVGLTARWRLPGSTDDRLQSAGFEEFKNWLRAQQAVDNQVLRAVLLLSGEQVVNRAVAFSANEKKHLQKLLPFMLESQLAVDLSQVHVAHMLEHDQSAMVAYTDRKQLQWRIDALESMGLEVGEVFSIPAILPATQTSWSLLLDSDICHLHAGNLLCASMEAEMLPVLIDVVISESVKTDSNSAPVALTLFFAEAQHNAIDASTNAPEQVSGQSLMHTLSEHAGVKAAGIRIRLQQVANAWAALEINNRQAVNLRQGEFAAPLRLAKYWKQWRVPAIAAMLAITTVLVTAIVETQINQYRFRALESGIEQRYREVMPEGVLVDAVQQLSAQVSQRRSAVSTQSLTRMLAAMLEPFENADGLNLHRLGYSSGTQAGGASAEIQLSISAPSAAEILQLSENLNAAGWNTQAQNISRVGDAQQASLLVRGNTP